MKAHHKEFYAHVVSENKKHVRQFKFSFAILIFSVIAMIVFFILGAERPGIYRLLAVFSAFVSIFSTFLLIMSLIYIDNEDEYLNNFKQKI